jgi:predicted porin
MGPHNLFLQYAAAGQLKGGVCGIPVFPNTPNGCSQTKSHIWSVGYNYSLSKRTMIKAVYSDITNQGRANYDFYTSGVAGNGAANGNAFAGGLPNGADPQGFGVGLRHVF